MARRFGLKILKNKVELRTLVQVADRLKPDDEVGAEEKRIEEVNDRFLMNHGDRSPCWNRNEAIGRYDHTYHVWMRSVEWIHGGFFLPDQYECQYLKWYPRNGLVIRDDRLSRLIMND